MIIIRLRKNDSGPIAGVSGVVEKRRMEIQNKTRETN